MTVVALLNADPTQDEGGKAVGMFTAENVLLPLQRLQQQHDEAAHRDILSFDLYKRLKHMVLHFYKYAGNIECARAKGDRAVLHRALLDTFIICLASANAMNMSLGADLRLSEKAADMDQLAKIFSAEIQSADLFAEAVKTLVVVGGAMAKAIESADHMELGDPRSAMQQQLPRLARPMIGILGNVSPFGIEAAVRNRLAEVEQRSVLLRPYAAPQA